MLLKNQFWVGNADLQRTCRKPNNGAVAIGGAAFYRHAILYFIIQSRLDVAQESVRAQDYGFLRNSPGA